jgi:hypothetical protein
MTGSESLLLSEAGGSVAAIDLLKRASKLCRKHNKSHKNFREINELLSDLNTIAATKIQPQSEIGQSSKPVAKNKWNFSRDSGNKYPTLELENINRKSTSVTPTKSPHSTIEPEEAKAFHVGMDILSLLEGRCNITADLLHEDMGQTASLKKSAELTPQSLVTSTASKKKPNPIAKDVSLGSLEYSKDMEDLQEYKSPTEPFFLDRGEEIFIFTVPRKDVGNQLMMNKAPKHLQGHTEFKDKVLGWKPEGSNDLKRGLIGSPEWRKKYRNTYQYCDKAYSGRPKIFFAPPEGKGRDAEQPVSKDLHWGRDAKRQASNSGSRAEEQGDERVPADVVERGT